MSSPGAIDPLLNLQKELGELFVHESNKWSAYNAACLLHRKKPALGTVDQQKIEEMAKEKMKDRMGACATFLPCWYNRLRRAYVIDAFLYVFASAGTWGTANRNREAFLEWQIVPRMLRDSTSRSLAVSPSYPSHCLYNQKWTVLRLQFLARHIHRPSS